MAGGKISFYDGTDYGLDPTKGEFLGGTYRPVPAGSLGLTTDMRTANQIKAVSDKINAGAKTIEISWLSPEVAESVPQQHLQEINRLRKLAGAELTVHGPVIDPSGFTKEGWNEAERKQAEKQMGLAIERGHEMDPTGNVVVTFHSSALPETITKTYNPETHKEEVRSFLIVDDRSGQITGVQIQPNYLELEQKEGKTTGEIVQDKLKEQNEKIWANSLQHIDYYAHQGTGIINEVLAKSIIGKEMEEKERDYLKNHPITELYGKYVKGQADVELKKVAEDVSPESAAHIRGMITNIEHGDIMLRQSYADFKEWFDRVYDSAKRNNQEETLEKLNSFREKVQPALGQIKDNPSKVIELSNVLSDGVHLLRTIERPEVFRPLNDFVIEKSSETFSNLALDAYQKFEKKGKAPPIIAIENPPAGMGISRAEDLKAMIEKSRESLATKLVEKEGLSKSEAKEQAEKLIGATWDVGHINMIRKYGYGEEALIEETKKIAPFVKKVHLSDNFGFEHTELPMGMGNVPIKQELDILQEKGPYGEKVKKIIEAGQWYQHFQTTPFTETLRAFGSPIYSMQMQPYWHQTPLTGGQYFAGQGMLPENHFSIYGSGFSSLPTELGGQQVGKSRLSGTPID